MFCSSVFLDHAEIKQRDDRDSATTEFYLVGDTFIENLSFNKEVGFRILVDGSWRDIYMSYWRSLMTGGGGILEAWILPRPQFLTKVPLLAAPIRPTFRFSVFYHNLDSDEWFWDNNSGQDYFL
jgi:hypothetical protein